MMRNYVLPGAVIAIAMALGTTTHADEHSDHAHTTTLGSIAIEHAWARAAPAGSDTLVFMEIDNQGSLDGLVGASAELASSASIVGVTHGADGSGTVDLGTIELPPGDTLLDPSGFAIKLTGLKQNLAQGEHLDLVLQFENAGEIEIEVEIEAANAQQHSHAGHSH